MLLFVLVNAGLVIGLTLSTTSSPALGVVAAVFVAFFGFMWVEPGRGCSTPFPSYSAVSSIAFPYRLTTVYAGVSVNLAVSGCISVCVYPCACLRTCSRVCMCASISVSLSVHCRSLIALMQSCCGRTPDRSVEVDFDDGGRGDDADSQVESPPSPGTVKHEQLRAGQVVPKGAPGVASGTPTRAATVSTIRVKQRESNGVVFEVAYSDGDDRSAVGTDVGTESDFDADKDRDRGRDSLRGVDSVAGGVAETKEAAVPRGVAAAAAVPRPPLQTRVTASAAPLPARVQAPSAGDAEAQEQRRARERLREMRERATAVGVSSTHDDRAAATLRPPSQESTGGLNAFAARDGSTPSIAGSVVSELAASGVMPPGYLHTTSTTPSLTYSLSGQSVVSAPCVWWRRRSWSLISAPWLLCNGPCLLACSLCGLRASRLCVLCVSVCVMTVRVVCHCVSRRRLLRGSGSCGGRRRAAHPCCTAARACCFAFRSQLIAPPVTVVCRSPSSVVPLMGQSPFSPPSGIRRSTPRSSVVVPYNDHSATTSPAPGECFRVVTALTASVCVTVTAMLLLRWWCYARCGAVLPVPLRTLCGGVAPGPLFGSSC